MQPVGVLALQGDFREHIAIFEQIGITTVSVRKPTDLHGISGLVIPGGESTVIDKLSRIFEIREPLIAMIAGGLPVFGTCAGLIMLANSILDGTATQQSFGGLDIDVRRNAFGSQVESFEAKVQFGDIKDVAAAFIRAPIVTRVGAGVEVLSEYAGDVVAVRQGNLLGISFHPEITGETRVHQYFAQMCKDANFQTDK